MKSPVPVIGLLPAQAILNVKREPVRVVSLTRQFSCRGTKSPSFAPFFTHNRCDTGGMAIGMPAISIFIVTSYWSSLPCADANCATGSTHTPATATRPRQLPTTFDCLAFIDPLPVRCAHRAANDLQ